MSMQADLKGSLRNTSSPNYILIQLLALMLEQSYEQ